MRVCLTARRYITDIFAAGIMTSGVTCEQLAEPHHQQQQITNHLDQVHQEDTHSDDNQAVPIGGRQFRSQSDDSGQLSLISSFGSISINQTINGNQHPRFKQSLASESSQEFSGSNYVDYHQYCSLMLLNTFGCCEGYTIDDHHQHYLLHESLKSLPNEKQESLAERRARWFADLEQQQPQVANTGVDQNNSDRQKGVDLVAQQNDSKQLEAENCQTTNKSKTKRGGKKIVAALAATQSSLMDKFWTHVVKKAATSNNNGDNVNNKRQSSQKEPVSHNQSQSQHVKEANATQSGGGIYLLSDLSRRLVRRCGVGGMGAKMKTSRVQSTSESALEKSSSRIATRQVVGGDNRAGVAMANEHRHGASAASLASASCQQLGGLSNLNASVSTLNTATTPSGCCYCDNETCSSSGFLSSSAATTAPALISSVASRATGGSNSPSFTAAATNNCCSDSIANHSCSSSTYNDHHLSSAVASPASDQEFQTSLGIEELKWSSQKANAKSNTTEQAQQLVRAAVSGTMAAANPIALAIHHHQHTQSAPKTTIIEEPAEQHDSKEDASTPQQSEIKCDMSGSLKPKGSFLSRARNSTINLASLAPITNRFSCSASVGNLWNHHHQNGHHSQSPNSPNNASELLTPEHDDIRTLEYVPCQTFDENKAEHRIQEVKVCKKSHSSHKLFGAHSCEGSTRKLSTKEKCRRQKDAERVEKLRLLVSYLRSGSSQPVVSPVTLEADEIELAERYKLHIALRDDLLDLIEAGDQVSPKTIGQKSPEQTPVVSTVAQNGNQSCKTTSVTVTSNNSASTSSCSMNQNYRSSVGAVDYGIENTNSNSNNNGNSVISTPAAPNVKETQSTPHIGQVSWMLRHSISDPGHKFSQDFNRNAIHYSSTSAARSSTALTFSTDQHHRSIGQFSSKMTADLVGQVQKSPTPSSAHQRASSYKAVSGTYYTSDNQNNNNSSSSSSIARHNQQHKRLFYIDDLDAPQAHLPPLGPKIDEVYQHHLMPTATITNVSDSIATTMTQASSSGNFTSSSICSNSTKLPHTTASSTTTTMTSTKSCSAWTNPQNLATWIDNEVNSLVHDLEVNESQRKLSRDSQRHHHSSQKHNPRQSDKSTSNNNNSCKVKDGKRKWLSVTGGNIRRNSSGAQST